MSGALVPAARGGAVALTPPLPRLGFLGVGWIGWHRLASLAMSGAARVAMVADASGDAAAAASRLVPHARVGRSMDELLAEPLDGIVIATPSALHADQTIAALERGRAVFCQKPLARTGDESRRVVEAARRADRLLHVDFCYRHLAAATALRQLVRDGGLGDVYAVEATFHNAYGPSQAWSRNRRLSGGGALIDLGVHLVDLVLWLLDGARVVEAVGRRYAGGRRLAAGDDAVEDFASARLDLDTGTTVTLACSWQLPMGRDCVIRVVLHGTHGGATLENVGGSFYDFRAERHRRHSTDCLCAPPDPWGGRAAVRWARRLAVDPRFDQEAERFVEVAAVLDRIYAS
jgi:predicted dehydrogenase